METTEKRLTFSEILATEPVVLVDFYTEWCGPCKMMKPVLEDVKTRVGDLAKIVKIDVDKNSMIGDTYQIMSVPTLALFKSGKMVWRQSGVMPPAQLEQIIRQHCD